MTDCFLSSPGTALIILDAPSHRDTTTPIDIIYSKLEKKTIFVSE